MELVEVKDERYEQYVELLIRKDALIKDAYQYEVAYIREFGDLMVSSFELKIECIKKKKIIAYCQRLINQGKKINGIELDNYINNVMGNYYDELDKMIKDNKNAKGGSDITEFEFRQIKKIYYRIAKMIHPDINPKLAEDPIIKDYWIATCIAYQNNSLKKIEELEVMIKKYLEDKNYQVGDLIIDDIEFKIDELNNEINEILNSNPYQYKYILDDQEEIDRIKAELKQEIEDYRKYSEELDETISKFEIERAYA